MMYTKWTWTLLSSSCWKLGTKSTKIKNWLPGTSTLVVVLGSMVKTICSWSVEKRLSQAQLKSSSVIAWSTLICRRLSGTT
jgi:hypothetical protein